uniref:Uncharacterized protein n=1 Tax=Arundo donax TaxID=35708 RepID=A0A0A9BXA2_ARUDO
MGRRARSTRVAGMQHGATLTDGGAGGKRLSRSDGRQWKLSRSRLPTALATPDEGGGARQRQRSPAAAVARGGGSDPGGGGRVRWRRRPRRRRRIPAAVATHDARWRGCSTAQREASLQGRHRELLKAGRRGGGDAGGRRGANRTKWRARGHFAAGGAEQWRDRCLVAKNFGFGSSYRR